mgnify:CR=1 FL=1
MKNHRLDHNTIELSNNNEVNDFFETDREQAELKRSIELISIYLINLFYISPYEKGLVFLLCGEFQKNNKKALNVWINKRLSEENKNDVDYWKYELEKSLSELY